MKTKRNKDYPLEYEDDFVPAFYVSEVLIIIGLVVALAILILLNITIVEVLTGTL